MGGATDSAIWEFARQERFLFVTKDEDFVTLSVLRGTPPKVIWLNIGNADNGRTLDLLLHHADAIQHFASHPDAGFLALGLGATRP